jgi:YVTN family beta-propeller protein
MKDQRRVFFIGMIFLLAFLMSISITYAEPYAYITNYADGTVSVIDTATNTVTATVPVGIQPYGVGINPNGTKVYVANSGELTNDGDHTVSIIDTSNNTVTATVNVGKYPKGVVVSPDGTKVYVTDADGVSVIDTATNTVTAIVHVSGLAGITVTPDGTKVYAANWASNDVSVINTTTDNVTATVPVGSNPFAIAVNPDGTKAYVTNYASNTVSVIDTATDTVIATVPVGSYVRGIAVSPDEAKVYVANWIGYDALSVIDTVTNVVIANVPVGSAPWGVGISPDGTKVYVTNLWSATVAVIDTATNTVTDMVSVGSFPNSLGQFIGPLQKLKGVNLYISGQAPASKDHGSSMTYTLHYCNFGNATAQDVVLIDELSSNVKFESASDGGVYNSFTRTVRWDIGSVDSRCHGYRTLNVSIPEDVPVGTAIFNNANISTSYLEVRYDDNEAKIRTRVTGSPLPPNVEVGPTNGGIPNSDGIVIPSVYWGNHVTFSYHSCPSATAVDIRVQFDDGTSIVDNMAGGPSDWRYTITFYPHHGSANVTYTVHGCEGVQNVSFNIYVDPAGYIYDVDTGERIAGASVWLQRPDGLGDWENVPIGQTPLVMQPDANPLITDQDGMYQWDTLEGSYRVYVEAPGYEPNNSIVVSVPPPVTDLHVGLHHINVPPVADAGGPYEGTADVAVRLNGSGSYDPDADWNDSIVSYDWDLDGDGSFDDATGATITHVWDHEYSGQIGLRVTDGHGGIGTNYTTVNISEVQQDITPPTIQSVVLFPSNTTAGSNINITVNTTDNVGVAEVKAGDVSLIKESDGFWRGNLTSSLSRGDYSLLVKANDTSSNTAETSVPYHVVQLSGGASITPSPKISSVAAGSNVSPTIIVKNAQSIDDTFKIWISVSELPASSQANVSWFAWTEQSIKLRVGEEVTIPVKVDVPVGTAAGRKLFRVNVKSETTVISGFNTGYLTIT